LVAALELQADLVEVNISSPNTRLVYELSGSPARVRGLLRLVREATRKPLILKLSPDYPDENRSAIVPAALDAGIDALNFGNTRRIDEPRLSQRSGGLSGPELFPTVLETVRELRRTVGPRVGVIATGGVDTAAHALAALEAGADAVGCFTAFITRGPAFPRRVNLALLEALEQRGLHRLADLRLPALPDAADWAVRRSSRAQCPEAAARARAGGGAARTMSDRRTVTSAYGARGSDAASARASASEETSTRSVPPGTETGRP
jgi:dihydroorotate dehydrogenase